MCLGYTEDKHIFEPRGETRDEVKVSFRASEVILFDEWRRVELKSSQVMLNIGNITQRGLSVGFSTVMDQFLPLNAPSLPGNVDVEFGHELDDIANSVGGVLYDEGNK
ncbi:hypothetical protein C8R46DRAFT_1034082 [Mycena filopes]|nr:hypothetical protein C8R46DRAFT_1034082 [Mycena filopes]